MTITQIFPRNSKIFQPALRNAQSFLTLNCSFVASSIKSCTIFHSCFSLANNRKMLIFVKPSENLPKSLSQYRFAASEILCALVPMVTETIMPIGIMESEIAIMVGLIYSPNTNRHRKIKTWGTILINVSYATHQMTSIPRSYIFCRSPRFVDMW